MNSSITAILAIVSGLIGLAIISVLVSPKAQTGAVLGAGGSALSNVIASAVSPVTGQAISGTAAASGGFSSGGGIDFSGALAAIGTRTLNSISTY